MWRHTPPSHLIVPLLAGILLFLFDNYSDMDHTISRLFFDESQSGFPLRHNFILQKLLHDWLKDVLVVLALGLLPAAFFVQGRNRRALLFAFGTMVVASTLIAVVKKSSSVSCPFDLTMFGGAGSGGGCWPSGHASVGYSLFACYFAARWLDLRWARTLFIIALTLGLLLTITQTLRGEHFLSHGLWTGLFIWFITLTLATLLLPPQEQPK